MWPAAGELAFDVELDAIPLRGCAADHMSCWTAGGRRGPPAGLHMDRADLPFWTLHGMLQRSKFPRESKVPDRSSAQTGADDMTSYLVLYMTQGAKLFGRGENARGFRLSPFGVLPHEIAALNARRSAGVCTAIRARDDASAEPVGGNLAVSEA